MGSSGKAFADSGPMHMMTTKTGAVIQIDWENEEHRRCITACLVKGTYLLESERTNWEDDDGDDAKQLAPAWWESFHFRRHRVLACVCECALCKIGHHIMAPRELDLPAFLFNPPQVSLASLAPAMSKVPIPEPVAEAVKRGVHTSSCLVKHVLGKTVLRPHKKNMEDKFERLSAWAPNLFVHPRDVICSGFIDYFEQRERVQGRLPRVAASGTILSYRDMGRAAISKQNDRPHLLPSAVLWKNRSPDGNPHELRQWWQPQQGPELELTSKVYKWPIER